MPRDFVVALILVAGCGAGEARTLARVRVDTLPGGALSVVSEGPTAWRDTMSGWRVTIAGKIGGDAGTPGELIDPQSVAVDDAGRLYVTDDKPTIIKVFASDGRFLHTIGREGEGPGEFKTGYLAVHGTSLVVHDPRLSRTSVFDTSGAYLRSWTTACCYYGATGVDTAGRISVLTMTTPEQKRTVNYVRYALTGERIDTVGVPASPVESKYWTVKQGKLIRMATGVPGAPRMVNTLDPAGGVIYGFSGDYRLVRSATGRDTAQLFGRTWTAPSIPEATRRRMYEDAVMKHAKDYGEATVRASFNADDIPTTEPAFTGIMVDRAGNRWVQVPGGGTGSTHYDVFDARGRLLGPVVVPRLLSPYGAMAWGREDLYAALESEDGTPAIMRLHLDRGAAK